MSELCPICQEAVDSGIIRSLSCGHKIHEGCLLDLIFQEHHSCPICKRIFIQNKEEENVTEVPFGLFSDLDMLILKKEIKKISRMLDRNSSSRKIRRKMLFLDTEMQLKKDVLYDYLRIKIKYGFFLFKEVSTLTKDHLIRYSPLYICSIAYLLSFS